MTYFHNRNQPRNRAIMDRFNEKYIFIQITGCWEWQSALNGKGYAQFNKEIGSRFSYKQFIGDIPKGYDICHKCDNPKCVSPFHLFLGTRKANINDAQAKGRFKIRSHPSYSHWVHGCRCEECRACYRIYFEDNKDKFAAANRKARAKKKICYSKK